MRAHILLLDIKMRALTQLRGPMPPLPIKTRPQTHLASFCGASAAQVWRLTGPNGRGALGGGGAQTLKAAREFVCKVATKDWLGEWWVLCPSVLQQPTPTPLSRHSLRLRQPLPNPLSTPVPKPPSKPCLKLCSRLCPNLHLNRLCGTRV